MSEGPGLWAVALRAALDTFEELGLDVAALCEEVGLDRGSLDDPDMRVPLSVAGRIWPVGVRLRGGGGLGLAAAAAMPFGRLGALDYGFATASTVIEGLRCVEAYFEVTTGGRTGIRLLEQDDVVQIEHFGPDHPELRDYAVGPTVGRVAWAVVSPRRVLLAGPPAAAPGAYRRALGCEVSLDAAATVVELSLEAAHAELLPDFPGLRTLVEREMLRQREVVRQRDGLEEIRRELLSAMGPAAPTLAQLARRLRVSPRTLQRHLASRGVSFTALLDETRRALAERYLAEADATIGEIAYLLGFSEPGAFTRAFKRWTGHSPAEYRRARRGA